MQELKHFTTTGRPPTHGDQDLRFCQELQQKRLQKKNLIMKYDITPRGHFAEGGGFGRSWSDDRYVSRMEYRTCAVSRAFYRENKRLYEKSQDSLFYQIITDIKNPQLAAEDNYTCPNCGAVNGVEVLQKGCAYCGTFFEMEDLFPKVTNYFFIKDSGGTREEINQSIVRTIRPWILAMSIGYMVCFWITAESDFGKLWAVIGGILAGILSGSLIGYTVWAFGKIGSLFVEAGKALPRVFDAAGSNQRFVNYMKKYSPEFSYEYFSGKVVSAVKMILYSEDATQLPYYAGAPLGGKFHDIIESSYTGAVGLKNMKVQDGWCYVTVNVHMEDIYERKGRISSKNEFFRVELKKDLSRPVDYHFSISKVQCKHCGSSFDAARQKCCPNCGNAYRLTDEDWIVTKIM